MARFIVRWSIDGEKSNETGNAITDLLRRLPNISRVGRTACWEGNDNLPDVLSALRDVLNVVESPKGGGKLDHLWIYVDQTSELVGSDEGASPGGG